MPNHSHVYEHADLAIRLGRVSRKSTEYILSGITLIIGLLFIVDQRVFGAPLYTLMALLMPSQVWGLLFFFLGTTRAMTVWANGYLPIGPVVRRYFSIATQVLVWLPLTITFWWWAIMAIGLKGEVLPGVAMAPGLMLFDLLAFATLSASIESQRRAKVSGDQGSDT